MWQNFLVIHDIIELSVDAVRLVRILLRIDLYNDYVSCACTVILILHNISWTDIGIGEYGCIIRTECRENILCALAVSSLVREVLLGDSLWNGLESSLNVFVFTLFFLLAAHVCALLYAIADAGVAFFSVCHCVVKSRKDLFRSCRYGWLVIVCFFLLAASAQGKNHEQCKQEWRKSYNFFIHNANSFWAIINSLCNYTIIISKIQ